MCVYVFGRVKDDLESAGKEAVVIPVEFFGENCGCGVNMVVFYLALFAAHHFHAETMVLVLCPNMYETLLIGSESEEFAMALTVLSTNEEESMQQEDQMGVPEEMETSMVGETERLRLKEQERRRLRAKKVRFNSIGVFKVERKSMVKNNDMCFWLRNGARLCGIMQKRLQS
jgi:hypothetical protein